MSIFNVNWFGTKEKKEEKKRVVGRQFTFTTNPFNELMILSGHSDFIRVMLRMDETTMITCSDDCLIILWDFVNGKKISVLKGHRSDVRCLLLLKDKTPILASGGCDKNIILWNLKDGSMIKTLSDHKGTVMFLVQLENNRFCSGDTEGYLLFWSHQGELIATIKRYEEDTLLALIPLPNNKILTACHQRSDMYIYDTNKYCNMNKILEGPFTIEEDVKKSLNIECVKIINVTGYINGTIIIWDCSLLNIIQKITLKPQDWNIKNIFFKKITILENRFICALIGNGFFVYDFELKETTFKKAEAHKGLLNDIISIHEGKVLVTCSDDSSIMFWDFTFKETIEPLTIGKVSFHSSSITEMLKLSEYSFSTTVASDKTLTIWKDNRIEKLKRLYFASNFFTCAKRGNENTEMTSLTEDELEEDIETNV